VSNLLLGDLASADWTAVGSEAATAVSEPLCPEATDDAREGLKLDDGVAKALLLGTSCHQKL